MWIPPPHLTFRPVLALAGAGTLLALAAAPGAAAPPLAQADATALEITLLDTPAGSDTVKAVHDGDKETVTGTQDPAITVLGNQDFLTAGTLSQGASARVVDRRGLSAACAGLAGDGATLVAVEDGGFCLEPGNNATINAGTLQLQGVTIVESDLLAGLDQQLQAALQPLLVPVTGAVDGLLQTVLTSLGDPGIVLDLGTIQSQCTATVARADGDSQITDASLSVALPAPAGTVALVEFPTNPPPNTKVVTDLDIVVETISNGVETQLETALRGALGPASPVVDRLVTELNANVLSALADQLAPLEENVLDGTLNKQTRGDRSIEVTALDLNVLPAAADFLTVAKVEIGRSSCGTNNRPVVTSPESPAPTPSPAVPTSVPAGDSDAAGGGYDDGAINGQVATGAIVVLTLLAAAAGVHAFRRVLGS